MSCYSDSPLSSISIEEIENVYIFVSDALRWDSVPNSIKKRGIYFKTVASGLSTPQAMPSIATGQYPSKHGITWFNQALSPNTKTIFDFKSLTTGFNDNKLRRPLNDVLGGPANKEISELSSPFVCLELDHGGHAPFPALPEATPRETMQATDGNSETLKEWYAEGVQESVKRFERRLELLEERELEEETLVIFTSDHGELLGEHNGFAGHGYPPCPELAYVPTVLIHPDLPKGEERQKLIRHTDIFPTVSDVAGESINSSQIHGRSLFSEIPDNRLGYSHCTVHPPDKWHDSILDPLYSAPSIWDKQGGYVFGESNVIKRLLLCIYDSTKSGYTSSFNKNKNILSTLIDICPMYIQSEGKFGSSVTSKQSAKEYYLEVSKESESNTINNKLSEDTLEHLESLGYK
ncbi:sulfatase-like hydrolase/transferase [Halovenus salina]|uniref:Sulfatase-like hydrolase/transferase n=1 Tax=Halovenus salina TaxID=1510225 RepID=A0ABD5W1A7_9EURY|nr:sulfatase-like hydrolase/transferase [Halovenus salina]